MAVTETQVTSYGENLKNKFGAIGVGVILFIASFVLLWISQGQTNYGRIADKQSTAVAADTVDAANENAFVSVTGNLVSDEVLGDPEFLRPGPYLALTRYVEMYAWVQKSKSETKEKVGGQTETVTTYWNEKEWTSNPQDSSTFKEVPYPANPRLPYESDSWSVRSARIGAFTVDPTDSSFLPGASDPLPPTEQNAVLSGGRRIQGNYIYQGRGSMTSPEIGDVRISFESLPNNVYVTVFGKQAGSSIRRWTDSKKEDITLYRAIPGDRDAAIGTMKTEFKTLVLILTIGGFLAMWIGLQMMFGFIPGLLQVLPFLKNASKFIVGLVTFPVALVLSLVTIGISAIAHNPIVLIIVVALLIALIVFLASKKKKAAPATQ